VPGGQGRGRGEAGEGEEEAVNEALKVFVARALTLLEDCESLVYALLLSPTSCSPAGRVPALDLARQALQHPPAARQCSVHGMEAHGKWA